MIIHSLGWGAIRVTIDPGHGGEDHGAYHGDVKEGDLTLKISQKLYQLLTKDTHFQAQMIRDGDLEVTLEDRVKKSDQFAADIYLSVHANAHTSTQPMGAEFYIESQLPPDQESLLLAHQESRLSPAKGPNQLPQGDVESILHDLKRSNRILKSYQLSTYLRKSWTHKKKKMIRQGPFFVLNQNSVPAVLVEVGYLSNPKERERLKQDDYQWKIARQIHQGLIDFAKNPNQIP
jgi:N-acetylmuramoyl-L-alanine amidase